MKIYKKDLEFEIKNDSTLINLYYFDWARDYKNNNFILFWFHFFLTRILSNICSKNNFNLLYYLINKNYKYKFLS